MIKQTVYTIPRMVKDIDLAVCFADYNEDDVDGETRHWSNKNFVEERKDVYVLSEEEILNLLRQHTSHIMFKMGSVRSGGYSSEDDMQFIDNQSKPILDRIND